MKRVIEGAADLMEIANPIVFLSNKTEVVK